MKVITFSRTFPAYHPKAGQPTFFVEKILQATWDSCELPYYSLHEMLEEVNAHNDNDIDKFVDTLDTETIYSHKWHTIRAGNHWKKGDIFSPRVWSGKPYNSKQIIIAPDIEIKKVFDLKYQHIRRPFVTNKNGLSYPNGTFHKMALNDGFDNREDLENWLLDGKGWSPVFEGQIICWNESINY